MSNESTTTGEPLLEPGVDVPEDRTTDDQVDMTEPSVAARKNRHDDPEGKTVLDGDQAGDAGDGTHVDGAHGAHDHVSDNRYIVIAVILAVITAAEVVATEIELGPVFLPLLLFMMAMKFFIVASYFMHLKFDNKVFSRLFYTGLFLALFVYVAALLTFRFFES